MPQKNHAAKAAFLFPPKAARFSSEALKKRLGTLAHFSHFPTVSFPGRAVGPPAGKHFALHGNANRTHRK